MKKNDEKKKINSPSEFDIIVRKDSYQSSIKNEKVDSVEIIKKEEKDKNRLNLPDIQVKQNSVLELGGKSYADIDFSSGLKLPVIKHQLGSRRKISIFEERFMSEEPGSIEEFKNQIELVFSENFEHDSFVKKGIFHQKLVDSLLMKIDSKIRDNESTILQKQRQLLFLRKENSYILEKISSLKTNVNIHF